MHTHTHSHRHRNTGCQRICTHKHMHAWLSMARALASIDLPDASLYLPVHCAGRVASRTFTFGPGCLVLPDGLWVCSTHTTHNCCTGAVEPATGGYGDTHTRTCTALPSRYCFAILHPVRAYKRRALGFTGRMSVCMSACLRVCTCVCVCVRSSRHRVVVRPRPSPSFSVYRCQPTSLPLTTDPDT